MRNTPRDTRAGVGPLFARPFSAYFLKSRPLARPFPEKVKGLDPVLNYLEGPTLGLALPLLF